ncbi:MAG: phosphoribosyltransferase [Rubrivivax sp.]
MKPRRAPWKTEFPDVFIVADESAVKRHADYHAGKTGDASAAARLVQAMVPDAAIERVRVALAGHAPILASVHAAEAEGINAIPEALADLLAQRLSLRTDDTLVQINVVNHTGAGGFDRLARQALFAGDVATGAEYFLVDDFIGQGGTLANLRGFVEMAGAKVIGALALTGKPFSAKIAPSAEQLQALRRKHGQLEDWWREHFGFGFDALTHSEARYLERTADAHTIRDRVVAAQQAADSGHRQGDPQ